MQLHVTVQIGSVVKGGGRAAVGGGKARVGRVGGGAAKNWKKETNPTIVPRRVSVCGREETTKKNRRSSTASRPAQTPPCPPKHRVLRPALVQVQVAEVGQEMREEEARGCKNIPRLCTWVPWRTSAVSESEGPRTWHFRGRPCRLVQVGADRHKTSAGLSCTIHETGPSTAVQFRLNF